MICPFCTTEPEKPCAQCGRRGVAPAEPALNIPGFVLEDKRQRYWDALAADMRNPGLEDSLR